MPDPILSEAEFAAAFARHGRTLWVIAAAWVGRDDAMDLVQECARVAWQKRDRAVPGNDLRAWLAQIVRHLGANHRRQRRPIATDPVELAAVARPEPTWFEHLDVDALALDDRLAHALERLSEAQRAALLLHVVLGHSFAEVGELLGMPENTAASHARRARASLREQLADAAGRNR